jgi:hypothetical protein
MTQEQTTKQAKIDAVSDNATINQIAQSENLFLSALAQKVATQINEGVAKATKKADFSNINVAYESLTDAEIIALLRSDRVEAVTHNNTDNKTKAKINRATAIMYVEHFSKLQAGSIENALAEIMRISEKEIRYFFLFAFENEVKAVVEEEKNAILQNINA